MRYPNIEASVKSILMLLLPHIYHLWNKINAPKKSSQMRKQFVKNCKKWYTLNIKLIYKKGLTFFLKSLDSSLKLSSSLISANHTPTLDYNKITRGDKILLKCFSWRTEVPILITALKLQHVCIAEKEQLLHAASLLFLCHTSTELWNLVCKGLCHPLSIRNFTKGRPFTVLWIASC